MLSKKRLTVIIVLVSILAVGLCIGTMYGVGKWKLKNDITGYKIESGTEIEGESAKVFFHQGKEYCYKDNLINILCMGIDKEEPMTVRNDADSSMGQADAIFLLSMDLERKEIRVIAIPRDTMVTIQKYTAEGTYLGEDEGQITLQYAYGDGRDLSATLVAEQVSGILGDIPINAYLAINVHSLWEINNAIGGVDVTMDADYTAYNDAFVEGANVHLTGNLLENFIRGRDKRDPDGAYTRMHRMKMYMEAFFEKAKIVLKEDMMLPVRLLKELEKDIETDVTADEAIYLVTEAVKCSFLSENMHTLPGTNMLIDGYMEYHLDEEGVTELVLGLFYEENNSLAFWK